MRTEGDIQSEAQSLSGAETSGSQLADGSVPAVESDGLRGRIIETAGQLFLEHGYSKVSTSEIAEALGISKKTLYREFETKEEILRGFVLPRLRETSEKVDGLMNRSDLPFDEKLRGIMETIVL